MLKTIFKQYFHDLKWYYQDYFKVILLSQLLLVLVAMPVIFFLMQFAFNLSGIYGLTETNFLQLAQSWNGFAIFIVFLIFLVLLILMEFTLYFFIIFCHKQKKRFSFVDYFAFIKQKISLVLVFQFFLLFVYFVLLIPIGGINIISAITRDLAIPQFIPDELFKARITTIIYLAILSVFLYVNVRLSFSIQYFLMTNHSFLQSMKLSFKKTSGYTLKLILIFAGFTLLVFLSISFVQFISILPIVIADKFFISIAPYIAALTISIASVLFFVLIGLLKVLWAHMMTALFEKLEYQHIYRIKNDELIFDIRKQMIKVFLIYLFFASINNAYVLKNLVYNDNTNIIAHRGGDTSKAVENTISALEASLQYKPDFVEIDVMETIDGHLVLFHDESLARLANDSRRIESMTLAQLQSVTIRANGFSDHIVTLEDYLVACKAHDVKVLLEIKRYGEPSLSQISSILEVIEKTEMQDNVIIQSFSQSILDSVKEINQEIPVALLIAVNLGNLVASDVDYFSVESSSVNEKLVRQAHTRGQGIFVWTVNNQDLMIKYMLGGVDGIITSNLPLAYETKQNLLDQHTLTTKVRYLISTLI